jgi:hypothetical protein
LLYTFNIGISDYTNVRKKSFSKIDPRNVDQRVVCLTRELVSELAGSSYSVAISKDNDPTIRCKPFMLDSDGNRYFKPEERLPAL